MNVLYLSPGFPPNLRYFCEALARRGARVLGIGDSPPGDLPEDLRAALVAYVFVPSLADAEAVTRAATALADRYGHIDRVEAGTEMWLELAGRLRDRLRSNGPSEVDVAHKRRKSFMAEIFDGAGLARIPGVSARSSDEVRAFAASHGYPLVFKPDAGAGAARTFVVRDDAELTDAYAKDTLAEHLAQPFVHGDIVTYDGLVDEAGDIVFALSHRYDQGIMQVVSGGLDGHYIASRALPPALDALGRRAVEAFGLRRQLFHLEVFETPAGYVALEMNLRAPGGFSTDMMNFAADIDLYDLWARAVLGERLGGFSYERRYHVGHAGRRDGRAYQHDESALHRLLGPMIVSHRRLPRELAVMQGDVMFLLRSPDVEEVRRGIALVQARAE